MRVVHKSTSREFRTRPDGALVETHFNTFTNPDGSRNDSLEKEWSRLESAAFPVVRAFLSGSRSFDGRVDQEIKVLMFLHLARSGAIRIMRDRLVRDSTDNHVVDLLTDPKLLDLWEIERGGTPTESEIRALVEEFNHNYRSDNRFLVERMASVFNKMLDLLRDRELQLVGAPARCPFLLGDVPAVAVQGIRVGIHNGVGVDAAEEIRMPLSPEVGVVLRRTAHEHQRLSPMQAQLWNHDTWRCALRFVVVPPDAELSKVRA